MNSNVGPSGPGARVPGYPGNLPLMVRAKSSMLRGQTVSCLTKRFMKSLI